MAKLFSIISFICASKKRKKSLAQKEQTETTTFQSNEKKRFSKLNSNISSRALSMVKMISWRKMEVEEEEEEEGYGDGDDSNEAVWTKKIMMGERCRPLDFSGKIAYDSEGNLLADLPHRS